MEIGDEVLMFGIIDDVLAHHFTEARFNLLAIAYWQKAGEIARQRSANVEAVNHLIGVGAPGRCSRYTGQSFSRSCITGLAGAMLGPNPWIRIIGCTTSIPPGLGVNRPDWGNTPIFSGDGRPARVLLVPGRISISQVRS